MTTDNDLQTSSSPSEDSPIESSRPSNFIVKILQKKKDIYFEFVKRCETPSYLTRVLRQSVFDLFWGMTVVLL